MTRLVARLVFIAALLVGERAFAQVLLVTCTGGQCDYKPVASVSIDQAASVRVVAAVKGEVESEVIARGRQTNILRIKGLYRAASGVVHTVSSDLNPTDLAFPVTPSRTARAMPQLYWSESRISYADSAFATEVAVPVDTFAYVLSGASPVVAAGEVFRYQLSHPDWDRRRLDLLRGALRFVEASSTATQLIDALRARIKEVAGQLESTSMDPMSLTRGLREVAGLHGVYSGIVGVAAGDQAGDLLPPRVTELVRMPLIAEALRGADYSDQFLLKLEQMGSARWSVDDLVEKVKVAIGKIVTGRRAIAADHLKAGRYRLGLQTLSYAGRISCDSSLVDESDHARVLFVTSNQIGQMPEYAGPDRVALDQLLRQIDSLDPSRETLILERIRRGEELNASYLPIQLRKAEFFEKVGRYREALETIHDVGLTFRLDPAHLEDYLRLDARIATKFVDVVKRAVSDAGDAFDRLDFPTALERATVGLRADGDHGMLLYYAALSAAFLRQRDQSRELVSRFLERGNLDCVGPTEASRLVELAQVLSAKGVVPAVGGVAHWMSGVSYRPADVFYDPVSLGFLQPVARSTARSGDVNTMFTREDRSLKVKSIVTWLKSPNERDAKDALVFEATPDYGSLSSLVMRKIGGNPLVYWGSSDLDVQLIERFTTKNVARGWAGNPYFHPFIWYGLFLFEFVYDDLGRVTSANPVAEAAGSRPDSASEPLVFKWDGTSYRLLSIAGTRSGYLRTMHYDGRGRLKSETIRSRRGSGSIEYTYAGNSIQLVEAATEDNFFDKRVRRVRFDLGAGIR